MLSSGRRSPTRRIGVMLLCAIAVACVANDTATDSRSDAGLATAFDSSGDTIVARVDGDVPARQVRSETDELRIAPSADDTSLFGETAHFVVDRADRMWVFDSISNSIFLFAPDGTLIRRVGRSGKGPGEFISDGGMLALPDTGVASWDLRSRRLSFFDARGDFRTSLGIPGSFLWADALRTDVSGTFYLKAYIEPPWEATDMVGRMGLARLDSHGAVVDTIAPPGLDVARIVYVVVAPDGRSRSGTFAKHGPRYLWAWHPDGWFVVANGGTGEIVLARRGARPIVIRRSKSPVRVSAEENALETRRILLQMQHDRPGWSMPQPLPADKAPLTGLFVARDGRIWVRVATPSERIPDAELPPQQPNRAPVDRFREPPLYEVFDAEGRFLGRVALPVRAALMEGDGDRVWFIDRDADDLPAVVRARITPGMAPAATSVRPTP